MSSKSIEAYIKQSTSGNRVSDKARIVDKINKREKDTFYKEPFNTYGLGYHLTLKIQTLTARLSELNDEGIIELKDSGSDWSTVQLVPKERQQEVIDLRSKERLNRVRKIASDYGYDLVINKNHIPWNK